MNWLWTWSGKFFGYLEGHDLWTYDGKHVGKVSDDQIYDGYGRYVGEIANDNRLLVCEEKMTWTGFAYWPPEPREAQPMQDDVESQVLESGYSDFPTIEEFQTRPPTADN